MRGRALVLASVFVLLGSGCDWLQWGGGAWHQGSNFEPGMTRDGIAAMVASTIAPVPTTSSAVTTNGLVLVEQDGTLTAFDMNTYGIVWTASLPAGSTAGGAPAIDTGSNTVFVVVAGASNPVLVGFDVNGVRNCTTLLNTCSPVFRAPLGHAIGPASPPVVDGGRVYANGGTSVYAFDANGQTSCVSSLGTAICTPVWSAPTGFSASGVGPAVAAGVVYDPVQSGATFGVRAFDAASGASRWTGTVGASPVTATPSVGDDGRVFVPAGSAVSAFAGGGCGSATCPPSFRLVQRTGDAAGSFLGTPAIDGATVYATNGAGRLYGWSETGCRASTCQPTLDVTVNTPLGGSSTYSQSPVLANGVLFVLTQQVVAGANHVVLVALGGTHGSPVASWDLGARGFGAGLANASVAWGVVYAPVDRELVAVHPKPVRPLASLSTSPLRLTPGFSPATFDYVVRCAPGTNSFTIRTSAVAGGSVALLAPTTTAPSASQTNAVQLAENGAAVVQATDAQGATAQYWIRCLPSDFPPLTVTPHPAVGKPTPGWYLVGNNITPAGVGAYAMILDTRGTPVWYKRGASSATNVTSLGHDSLAFMPNPISGYGTDPNGEFDAYSLETNQVTAIRTVGMPTDVHELLTLANGNHLLLSYPPRSGVDLTGLVATPIPGRNSTIADCVVQEVDRQGRLVWQWIGSDHINPVTETTTASAALLGGRIVYDVFHCNSIDAKPGRLLLSARHLDAVFELRRSDGKIVWKMGGKPVNRDGAAIIQIQNDPLGGIAQQHDARYLPNGDISVFDNQYLLASPAARGIEYSLNLTAKTAQPVFSFTSPDNAPSCCMGNFRRYSDGHSVIGWGFVIPSNGRILTEIDPAGRSVLDVAFANGYASYRSVKVPSSRFDINILRLTAGR